MWPSMDQVACVGLQRECYKEKNAKEQTLVNKIALNFLFDAVPCYPHSLHQIQRLQHAFPFVLLVLFYLGVMDTSHCVMDKLEAIPVF